MLDRLRSRLADLLPGTAERRAQTAAYAAAWEAHNARVLAAHDGPGPLWVALGDSASQGIGASSHLHGWVGQVLELLRAEQDPAWEVCNLSVTGARIADVLDDQIPRLGSLREPALVTCAVGANDMLRGRAASTLTRMGRLLDELPTGTVVATIPQGVRPRLARQVNALIRSRAPAAGLAVADVWAHTGPPWSGKYASDGFHPNDRGYEEWVDAYVEPLGLDVGDRD